jgi:hypothetical protein
MRRHYITKWRGARTGEKGRIFVSLAEVRGYIATGQPTGGPEELRIPGPAAYRELSETVELRKELARCRAELAGARETIGSLRDAVDAQKVAVKHITAAKDETIAAERARADSAERRAAELLAVLAAAVGGDQSGAG